MKSLLSFLAKLFEPLGPTFKIVAALFIAINTGSGNAFADPRKIFITVMSGSMEPLLHVGNKYVQSYCTFRDCKKGDVVVFHAVNCKLPVVHRLVRQVPGFPGYWITQGDANSWEDPGYVWRGNFISKVVLVPGHSS